MSDIHHRASRLTLPHPTAHSAEASTWLDEHVTTPEQLWYAGALVAEPRYVEDLIEGMRDDGLEVG